MIQLADGGWIKPRFEPYYILHGGPMRIGDHDEIRCDSRKRKVRVMLRKDVHGKLWLVEVKRRAFAANGEGTKDA